VASDIVKSYERCLQGDFQHITVLEELYEKLRRRPRNDTALKSPSQDDVEEGDDDDDDGGTVEDEEEDGEAMDVETSQENSGPIIDEDGFQLVQGKGKRRGR
jgi:pre-rRNA-processing protein TSR2